MLQFTAATGVPVTATVSVSAAAVVVAVVASCLLPSESNIQFLLYTEKLTTTLKTISY